MYLLGTRLQHVVAAMSLHRAITTSWDVKLIWVVCASRVPARHDATAHQVLWGDVAAVHRIGRGVGGPVCALLEGGLHAAALHQRCPGAGHDGDEHLVSCSAITELQGKCWFYSLVSDIPCSSARDNMPLLK